MAYHHTPQATAEALKFLTDKTNIEFYDSSYKNDLLDSIEVEVSEDVFLKIFIPNSTEDDEASELFNKYFVTFNGEDLKIFESLKDLEFWISKNYELLEVMASSINVKINEDGLHELAIKLMQTINKNHRRSIKISLDEYLIQFEGINTDLENKAIKSLLNEFNNL